MEDNKRRVYIKQQAAKKKEGSQLPKGTGPANSSTKRKPVDKTNHLPKKPKVTVGPVEVTRTKTKLPPPLVHGKGKGLIMGQVPANEKRLILLREDP